MSETKFTPGPWNADTIGYVWAPEQMMVCEIRGWGHLTGVGGLNLPHDEALQIQNANALLIAAAPDLYAALEAAEAVMSTHVYPKPDVGPEHPYAVLCRMREALKKARGE